MTDRIAIPDRVVVVPEFVVGHVVAVRGYREVVEGSKYVGPRSEFRYDIRVFLPECGMQEFRDVLSVGAGYPTNPWCYSHPVEEEVWGRRIGNDYRFRFEDFLPWIGSCTEGGG